MATVIFVMLFVLCVLLPYNETYTLLGKKKTLKQYESPFKGGVLDNPGVQIVLSKKGLDYVSETAGDILNTEINKLIIPDFRTTMEKGGWLEANNLHITRFVPPKYTFEMTPDGQIRWSLNGAYLTLVGNWKGEKRLLINFSGHGSFEASVSDLSLSLTVTLGKSTDGRPVISKALCQTNIGKIDLKLKGGIVVAVVNLFSSIISKKIKPSLETEICKKAQDFLMNDTNSKLQSFPTSLKVTQNMTLDLSLTENPAVQRQQLSTLHVGEFIFMNSSATPFGPHKLNSNVVEDLMIHVFVSDYVLNSFFYQAHSNNLTSFVVHNRSFLALECPGSFCLGILIPAVSRKYPTSTAKILINTLEPPSVRFSSEGFASMSAKIITNIVAVQESSVDVNVLSALVNFDANLNISMLQNNVTGKIHIKRFDVSLINSTVQLDFGNDFNPLANFIRPLLEEIVNNELKKGILIQLSKGIKIVKPCLKLTDRTFHIQADILYERAITSD